MSPHRIPLAGVIGRPVAHSLSPRLHGHWLARLGLPGHYVPLHVEPGDLAAALTTLPRIGFVGANVTLPHKEAVLTLADSVTERAARIGAANTLTFTARDGLVADNTDAYGFMANLAQRAPAWRPGAGPALVIGAGGASRAVLAGLQDAGVADIFLANRTEARARALAHEFGAPVETVDWDELDAAAADAALIVNTTSLGMEGEPPFPDVLRGLRAGTVAADIVYVPLETGFLRQAARAGAHCVDGLGMLLHQAVPGFERWFGARPVVDETTRAAVTG